MPGDTRGIYRNLYFQNYVLSTKFKNIYIISKISQSSIKSVFLGTLEVDTQKYSKMLQTQKWE